MIIELLKAVLFGVVEGITEWLPVSSTGHMILLDQFIKLQVSADFYEMFHVVIQLGAILAVLLLFFKKLNPFKDDDEDRKQTLQLWLKVIVAVLPSAVLGLLLDDWMDEHLYNYVVVAITLIIYGVAFIFMEKFQKSTKIDKVEQIDYRTALLIGAFQCLSLIPGTSRSGATILGALLLGVSRPAGAEFSFFLAIPTMLGASGLKILKYGKDILDAEAAAPTGQELLILAVGCVVSLIVSLLVIRALMDYVRKHSFSVFGIYRIVLGVIVLAYFLLK